MAYYQRDMLSIRTRVFLAKYITQIALSAHSLQPFRQALANIPHFDAIALFRHLDEDKKGFLNYQDLKKILGSSVQENYLMHGFSRLDSLKLGELNRLQFAQFLLPKQNTQLRELVSQRVGQPQQEVFMDIPFQNQTILQQVQIFSQMMQKIITQQIGVLSPMRQKLLSFQDYSIKAAMSALDVDRHGFISSEDLIKFIKGQGITLGSNQNEQRLIVDLFVQIYDSNLNGKLQLNKLEWALQAFQSKTGKEYLTKLKSAVKKGGNIETPTKQKAVLKNHSNKNSQSHKNSVFQNKNDEEISFQGKQNKSIPNKTVKDKQQKISSSFPEEYLKSLQLYSEREKLSKMIDQQLDEKELQINKQIDALKSEALLALKIKAEEQAFQRQRQIEIQQKLRLQKQIQIERQIKEERERLRALQVQRDRQYNAQRQLTLMQRNISQISVEKELQILLNRHRQRQRQRSRSLERQRELQMQIEKDWIIKRQLQNAEISRKCQAESQIKIQQCLRHVKRNKKGRIYSTNLAKDKPKEAIRRIDDHFRKKDFEAHSPFRQQTQFYLSSLFPYPTYSRNMHPDLQEHLQVTDYHLQRSKKLRESIKKQRSLERHLYQNYLFRNDVVNGYESKVADEISYLNEKTQQKKLKSVKKDGRKYDSTPLDNAYSSPEGRQFSKGKNLPSTGRHMQSTVTRKL